MRPVSEQLPRPLPLLPACNKVGVGTYPCVGGPLSDDSIHNRPSQYFNPMHVPYSHNG